MPAYDNAAAQAAMHIRDPLLFECRRCGVTDQERAAMPLGSWTRVYCRPSRLRWPIRASLGGR